MPGGTGKKTDGSGGGLTDPERSTLWRPPNGLLLGGRAYPISTDFRTAIDYAMAAADGTLSEALFRRLWFPAEQPEQLEEAVAGVGAFYNLGQTPEEEAEPGAIPYGFREDAAPIFAAFWKHYGVDLSTKKLHWWHFRALLEGLFTHSFRQRVEYRLCDLGGRTAQERAEIIKYRSLYRIGGGDLSDHLRTLDQIIDTHGERKG